MKLWSSAPVRVGLLLSPGRSHLSPHNTLATWDNMFKETELDRPPGPLTFRLQADTL